MVSRFIGLFLLFICSFTLQAQPSNAIIKSYPDEKAIELQLTLDDSRLPYQIGEQDSSHLVLAIPKTSRDLTDDLSIDQKDLVKSIDVKNVSDNTLITIEHDGPINYYTWQIDNKLVVNIKLGDSLQDDVISFSRPESLTRVTLKYLADRLDDNMIISDAVQSNISLDFRNVPRYKVLDLILQAKQLAYIKHESVYLIVPQQILGRIDLAFTSATYNTKMINSMNFENIDIVKSLLEICSSYSDKKIVSRQADLGTVTMRLKNIPWSQILADVIAIKGLTVTSVGNTTIVSYPSETY